MTGPLECSIQAQAWSALSTRCIATRRQVWVAQTNGVPEVAQAERPGHRLPGIRRHLQPRQPVVEQRLAEGPQRRWETTTQPGPER
jgi:hypothetical protein